jgi:hypothetical protein
MSPEPRFTRAERKRSGWSGGEDWGGIGGLQRSEGTTRLDWLQNKRGFASFSPVAGSDLAKSDRAKADTCAGQEPKESRRSPRSSRATTYIHTDGP